MICGKMEFSVNFGGPAISGVVHLLSPTAREAGKPTIMIL